MERLTTIGPPLLVGFSITPTLAGLASSMNSGLQRLSHSDLKRFAAREGPASSRRLTSEVDGRERQGLEVLFITGRRFQRGGFAPRGFHRCPGTPAFPCRSSQPPPVAVDAQQPERTAHGFGTPLPKGQVVFAPAALVGVALDN